MPLAALKYEWTDAHDQFCDVLESAYPRRQLFTIEELCDLFQCSRDTLMRHIKERGVITITTPGGIRIARAEIFKLVSY